MSNKILTPQLISMLVATTGASKKQAESFLKGYFAVITEALKDHETVKVKDFGTFKVNRVEARKSVNVSTGEEVRIPPHNKVVFTPSRFMAEKVNKELGWLDIIELSEEVNNDEIENMDTYKNPDESGEKLGEELERDFGIPEPSEPLGPLDPEDPEPGEPIPEDSSAPTEEETQVFDPYAHEGVIELEEETNPDAPHPLTEEEYESLAKKGDFKLLARNIKRLRVLLEEMEEREKERGKRTVLWSLIFSTTLLVGGFFVIYFMILNKIDAYHIGGTNQNAMTYNDHDEDDDYSASSIFGIEGVESSDADVVDTAAMTLLSGEAPTSPSDIKAVDKVTNTRYLTTMAKEHYGNYNFWPYIYIENEGKLGHPDRIKPGTTVVIPNIEKFNIDPSNPGDIEKAKRLGVQIYKKYARN